MSWNYDYEEAQDREDQQFAFELCCESCGETWLNTLGDNCPACGSASYSYDNAGASSWNRHMRFTGR